MILTTLALIAIAQETPVEIPKAELPKKARCVICAQSGETSEESAAAGVRYRGKSYFFCNKAEVAMFKKDPESYLPPVLPRPAPELNARLMGGDKVGLADYRGKVVLIDFWATWCKPCVKSMPSVDKLYASRKDKGFVALGISIDEDTSKVAPFLKKKPVSYPILLDSAKDATWAAYKVKAIPALFLVDRNGQVVAQWTGEPKMSDIEAAVDAALRAN
jgi:peroxiredoxin/YHS domain-containing protein